MNPNKYLLFIITIISGYFLSFVLPWWGYILPVFLGVYMSGARGFKAFLYGAFAGAVIWVLYAFYLDYQNQHLMAHRIGGIFGINNAAVLILVTGLIGAIPAGLAGLFGGQIRKTK